MPSALEMPVSEAYDWLFLRRQKLEAEMKWQAALHGAKLNGVMTTAKPQLSLRNFAMIAGARAMSHVEHIEVSREEMERRRLRQLD